MVSPSSSPQRLHVIISGRVQGVGFRYFTLEHANQFGLTGWVRNLPDGGVEVVAEGPVEDLEKFLELLKKGPYSAYVHEARADWSGARDEFFNFRVTY